MIFLKPFIEGGIDVWKCLNWVGMSSAKMNEQSVIREHKSATNPQHCHPSKDTYIICAYMCLMTDVMDSYAQQCSRQPKLSVHNCAWSWQGGPYCTIVTVCRQLGRVTGGGGAQRPSNTPQSTTADIFLQPPMSSPSATC